MRYKKEDIEEVLSLILAAQGKLWSMRSDASEDSVWRSDSGNLLETRLEFFEGLNRDIKEGQFSRARERLSEEASRLNLQGFLEEVQDPYDASLTKMILETFKIVKELQEPNAGD